MRILHVIDSLDPSGGGPPRVAVQLAATMARAGHEVRLLSRRLDGEVVIDDSADGGLLGRVGDEWRSRSAFAHVPGLERVERIVADLGAGWRGFFPRRLRSKLESLVSESDVVHLHGVWDALLIRVSAACRARGVGYVVRPAGMLDPWSLGQRWLKKRLALWMGYRRMLDEAMFVHVLNAHERAFIERLGLRSATEVIPNGTFREWLEAPPARGRFRAAYPKLGDRPFVLFLARLHYKKGLDYLAAAFRRIAGRVPGVMLVVAGPDEGARASFEAEVRASGLSDRVLLTGPLYGRSKLEALVDATCFCLPSRQEGFSVAVIEALAMGTPVVISEPCHFPEVAEAGAGLVVPLEAEALAAALERLVVDKPLRAKQSAAGVRLIREHYTWPTIAERCVKAYRSHGVAADGEVDERGVARRGGEGRSRSSRTLLVG